MCRVFLAGGRKDKNEKVKNEGNMKIRGGYKATGAPRRRPRERYPRGTECAAPVLRIREGKAAASFRTPPVSSCRESDEIAGTRKAAASLGRRPYLASGELVEIGGTPVSRTKCVG